MSEQASYDADVAALTTFMTQTLPNALAAIGAALADRGITDVTALDQLANTDLPAAVASLNNVTPAASSPAPASDGATSTPAPTA